MNPAAAAVQHHCNVVHLDRLAGLLASYGLVLKLVPEGASIPGSYWGEPEAGLLAQAVYVRADTPLHSALHEACHAICMDEQRRAQLHTDAGGEYAEEDAVCYLQIVLAEQLGVPAGQMCADMDAWGYSFRLGSAHAWYRRDAEDARVWLQQHGLLGAGSEPTFRLRTD